LFKAPTQTAFVEHYPQIYHQSANISSFFRSLIDPLVGLYEEVCELRNAVARFEQKGARVETHNNDLERQIHLVM
jgi:hypothetical protein